VAQFTFILVWRDRLGFAPCIVVAFCTTKSDTIVDRGCTAGRCELRGMLARDFSVQERQITRSIAVAEELSTVPGPDSCLRVLFPSSSIMRLSFRWSRTTIGCWLCSGSCVGCEKQLNDLNFRGISFRNSNIAFIVGYVSPRHEQEPGRTLADAHVCSTELGRTGRS